MPPPEPASRMMPSVLNRLMDPLSMGTPSAPGYNEKQMLDAVRNDLEDLLNTRKTGTHVPDELVELKNSIATFGLTDLTSFGGASKYQLAELAKQLAQSIVRFEPRLKRVKVTLATTAADPNSRSVKLHIEAALNVDPAPEVGFETTVELLTGRATVKPDGVTG